MDLASLGTMLVWRALERMAALGVGAAAIYAGYRLFWSLREHPLPPQGEGKLELPGGVSIYVSRVGPGVFFALFGTAIVALSVLRPLSIDAPAVTVARVSGTGLAGAAPAASGDRPSVSYLAAADGKAAFDQDRALAIRDLEVLGQLQPVLERAAAGKAPELREAQATRALIVLPHVRELVLRAVWDEAQWGALGEFEDWVRRGAPPEQRPARAATPAQAYLGVASDEQKKRQ